MKLCNLAVSAGVLEASVSVGRSTAAWLQSAQHGFGEDLGRLQRPR